MITYAALLDGVLPDILVNLKNNTENGTTIDIISAFDAVFEAVGPVLEEINKATPEDIYGLYKNFPWDGLWMIFNGAGEGIIDETEFNVDLIVRELMQPLYYIWGTFDPEALVGSIPKFLEDWDLESFIAALMNPAYWEQTDQEISADINNFIMQSVNAIFDLLGSSGLFMENFGFNRDTILNEVQTQAYYTEKIMDRLDSEIDWNSDYTVDLAMIMVDEIMMSVEASLRGMGIMMFDELADLIIGARMLSMEMGLTFMDMDIIEGLSKLAFQLTNQAIGLEFENGLGDVADMFFDGYLAPTFFLKFLNICLMGDFSTMVADFALLRTMWDNDKGILTK